MAISKDAHILDKHLERFEVSPVIYDWWVLIEKDSYFILMNDDVRRQDIIIAFIKLTDRFVNCTREEFAKLHPVEYVRWLFVRTLI